MVPRRCGSGKLKFGIKQLDKDPPSQPIVLHFFRNKGILLHIM